MTLEKTVESLLTSKFNCELIEIRDFSHLHKGHKTNKEGGRHLHLVVISKDFAAFSLLNRQREVMNLFKQMIPFPIHALQLELYTELCQYSQK